MKTLTSQDIEIMISRKILENLKVIAGKGKNKKIVISSGFKIEHIKSGLNYTVKDVRIENGRPVITAIAGDGASIEIYPNEFKNYRGL